MTVIISLLARHTRTAIARFAAVATIASLATTSHAAEGPDGGTTPATDAPPAVLAVRSLGLADGTVGAAALNRDARRLYVGLRYSYRVDRRNLVVVTLDDQGKLVGEPRRYADGTVELPEQTHASITGLLVDDARRKLYLTRVYMSAKPVDLSLLLTVWNLDEHGEPTGEPRSYECGNPHKQLQALAKHPRQPRLYLVGQGGEAVYTYRLDEQGWPMGSPQAFALPGHGKHEAAVSADGKRLYLGSYPDRLEVLDLDGDGLPNGMPRVFSAGAVKEYLHFQLAPEELLMRRATEDGPRLAIWPLDGGGNPIGEPRIEASLGVVGIACDAARRRLYLSQEAKVRDVFSEKAVAGGTQVSELTLAGNGSPGPSRTVAAVDGHATEAIALSAGGQAVLLTSALPAVTVNRARGDRLRVTLLELRLPDGSAADSATASFNVLGASPQSLGTLQRGQPSDWLDLDSQLKDRRGLATGIVTVGPPFTPTPAATNSPRPTHLKLRIEIAPGGNPGQAGKPKVFSDEVEGDQIAVLLPGYAYQPAAARDGAFELLSEHARRYLAAARERGLKPDERPRRFIVSCYQLMGGQGHREQLRMEAEMAGLLGVNTVNAYWWGEIPPRDIHATLLAHGLKWRSLAIYNPPSYFDFDRDNMNPEALARWAAAQAAGVVRSGCTTADVVTHYLADEPGWYYPTVLEHVRSDSARLEIFRDYLRRRKLTPSDVGHSTWGDVFPIGASAAVDLPARKLFYWTTRFFTESASAGHRLATAALERAFGHPVLTPVNWNNWNSRWYIASPGKKVANNPVIGPDSAYGSLDWLHAGRENALTPWTEDWFADQSAQTWSFYGDLIRSSAALSSRDFGGYLVGGVTGDHRAGTRLKLLALVGHGAKAVDFYTFGPELLFPGNCWSEHWRSYGAIADAVRALGRAERLLFPGKRGRGKVAIFMTSASGLWDTDQHATFYQQEIGRLHTALTHAGYTCDFVDDADVEAGALAARGYKALYLTAPNVSALAMEHIDTWVKAGGTLAATPGAGVADEYNTPTPRLTSVLGLQPRGDCRLPGPAETNPATEHATGRLESAETAFGGESLDLYGPLMPLEISGAQLAKVAGRLTDGKPAITVSQHGSGRAIAYAFFPGWQYWRTPDRSDRSRLPLNWSAAARRLAVAPARIAGAPRPVVLDHEVVEACRLQSDKGIAIVLLNWTDEPIERLTVNIPNVGAFDRVSSIERGALPAAGRNGGLTVTLPLGNTDVLFVE